MPIYWEGHHIGPRYQETGEALFFIRTKIDEDVRAEMRKKSFSEAAMLQKIRRNCIENLVNGVGNPISSEDEIFLIRNHHPDKWDFVRLTEAILDALLRYKRETLTMSLNTLTSLSKGILKRKVAIFKGRMILVAGLSAGAAAAPVPGLSIAVDAVLIFKEIREWIWGGKFRHPKGDCRNPSPVFLFDQNPLKTLPQDLPRKKWLVFFR